MQLPDVSEYAPYYHRYIALVPAGDFQQLMHAQVGQLEALLAPVSDAHGQRAYASGKWTLKEVIGHLADTERVFGFRALHIARGDVNPLPSFDQDAWAPNGQSNAQSITALLGQWRSARLANSAALAGMPEEALVRRGVVSGKECSVRALYHILPGHVLHHVALIREHYLT